MTALLDPTARRSLRSEVDDLVARAEAVVGGLDGDVLDIDLAKQLVERLGRAERIVAAGVAIAARRVADSNAWTGDGDRSPAHWVARETGTSIGAASATLDTSAQLDRLPALDEAVRAGEVSQAQAKEIAAAATADPGAERKLVDLAATTSLGGLREECTKVKATAVADENERHRKIHRTRRFRHWTDADGAFAFAGRATPEHGARLLAGMRPHHDRIFNEARKQERHESRDAYAMDALIALAEASPTPTSPASRTIEPSLAEPDTTSGQDTPTKRDATADTRARTRPDRCSCGAHPTNNRAATTTATGGPKALVHVRVDYSALVRGRTEPGETCEIPGIGPIPVATAKKMMNDAFLAAVVTDGIDVKSVAHMGRTIPAHLRTALTERDPQCRVPGCTASEHLEIDHVIPFADGGPTALHNLVRLCSFHHDQKTYEGYRLSGTADHPTWTKTGPSRHNPYRRTRASDRSPP